MITTSVEIQWAPIFRANGCALGVSIIWRDDRNDCATNSFWVGWRELSAAANAGNPYSIFDVLAHVFADRRVAEAILGAQRHGLVMPCSGTVH